MARLRRRWRLAKWAGVTLSLFVVVAWAVSLRWGCWYCHSNGRTTTVGMPSMKMLEGVAVGFREGSCVVGHWPLFPESIGWNVHAGAFRPLGLLRFRGTAPWWEINFPLWMPFILVAIPTGILWWLDPRRLPSHCCQVCGYDLTGNTSGVCPECGRRDRQARA